MDPAARPFASGVSTDRRAFAERRVVRSGIRHPRRGAHCKGQFMYGLFGRGSIRNLAPEEVARGLAANHILLIDVREPDESADERIRGALLVPLSRFDPLDLPDPQGREVVFVSASGVQ